VQSALASSLVGTGGVAPQTGRHAAEVCEAALRALFAIDGVDHCAVFLLDPSRRRLDPALWCGYPTDGFLVDGPAIVGQVARTGEPQSVPDLGPEAERPSGRARSALALPLRAGGETVGVLSLESRQPAAFPAAVASLCESVGQGISAALEGTDITERLLRAKVALEMTFDAMPELVAILDHDGRIRRLNKSLALRIGRPLRELLGEPLVGLLPFCREWLDGAAAATSGPQGARELQEPHTGAVYEATLLQIHGPTPILGERVVILRNVTEQREMARRMAAYERRAATGDLLLGVAHEVRNPLAAVEAAAASLALDAAGDHDRTMLVDIIREQVDRLRTLMSDLLDVARPSRGSERRSESLAAFSREVVDAWRRNPARTPREVTLHAPPGDELPVLIERPRIEQVLVNLLDNAAEHSPGESPIRIELDRRLPGLARVRTIDRGAGPPAVGVNRMFEPFFTTRAGGTGLGLCIAKGIVEDHGGHISASRNDPAPGLTVEFTLPLAAEAPRD
jgi:signal transduction histidine kinase/putative methionine-R-sulfoxide reductase with GAF domain